MTPLISTLLAIPVSIAALAWLTWQDPKRRRSLRLAAPTAGTVARRCAIAVLVLPGPALLLAQYAAPFLMWLMGLAVAGWLLTLSFARQPA